MALVPARARIAEARRQETNGRADRAQALALITIAELLAGVLEQMTEGEE